MKASLKFMVYFGMTLSFLAFGSNVTLTRADDNFETASGQGHNGNTVIWEQIVGILTMGLPNTVGGFEGDFVPWTARGGYAVVDLSSGKIRFRLSGLVRAYQPHLPGGTSIIGTSVGVTEVKGTLVCDALSTFPFPSSSVDTPAVPISPQGHAQFQGVVSIPAPCLDTPERLAFLIRMIDPIPHFERWIAHGAVRRP